MKSREGLKGLGLDGDIQQKRSGMSTGSPSPPQRKGTASRPQEQELKDGREMARTHGTAPMGEGVIPSTGLRHSARASESLLVPDVPYICIIKGQIQV